MENKDLEFKTIYLPYPTDSDFKFATLDYCRKNIEIALRYRKAKNFKPLIWHGKIAVA